MGDDFPVADLNDEVEIIFERDEEEAAAPAAAETSAEVATLRAEMAELRESYLRKLAEFDNFHKRTEREKADLRRTAGEEVVRELVPVLDNFERALLHTGDGDAERGAFGLGVEMIAKQLRETLERLGLEVISPAVGELFQPEVHEALQSAPSDDHPPGSVLVVHAKGYRFGGRLVRPALVVVAAPTAPVAEPEATPAAEGDPST